MSSVVINVKDFADPNFNAKSWINSVLKPSKNTQESSDESSIDTTAIVTNLQIASESTSRQFDQLSTHIIKSMPRILYDLKVISDNAQATQLNVEAVRKSLGLVEGHTEAAIDNLRRPHVAKTRMEECRMILLEKSDHLNKIREEQELRKRLEAEAKEEAERKAAAEAAEAAAQAEAEALAEQEERERRFEEERKETLLKEQQERERAESKQLQVDELSEEDDDNDYGQVQLPPIRQPEPKTRTTTLQQLNTNQQQQTEDNNNGYNVFKRMGVPLNKFW